MAVDMFLKITDIPGESRDDKHKDEIEIVSFSWAVSQSGTVSGGGGGGAGKTEFQDFSFAMPVSKASPKLFLACAKGEHLAEATLTVRKAGATQVDFLVYKLSDCIVSTYQEGADTGSELPGDAFTLNFAKIEISYKEQDPKGGVGAETQAGWDLKQNTAG
jgi:type VI secretion system secreted protein Hcp